MSINQSPVLRRAISAAFEAYKPPPRLLVSEWAGQYRHLSPEASAEPGLWNNDRALHLVKPMDCLSPYNLAERVVCKFSSQTGKTEIILNFCGYIIDCDPGPLLAIQPNVTPMGEAFSKDRIAPMLRDSTTLAEKCGVGVAKSSANTITHKSFPGGHLTIVGANSAAGLASRPVRFLVGDEIDRWEPTKEGDSLALARKRLQTFRVRRAAKELLVSSPTYDDIGICVEYDKCSQQWEWHLACLRCGEKQRPQLRFFEWDHRKPATVRYICSFCGAEHPLADADRVKAGGEWVCVRDDGPTSVAFWMNQWSSPFARWDDTVEEYLSAGTDPLKKQVVTNTVFAEPWEGTGDRVDPHVLQERAEDYASEVPAGVSAITIGVDCQIDRLEIEVVGWGANEESWSIAYEVIDGDPTGPAVWIDLAEFFGRRWQHASGAMLAPECMCIDSGAWTSIIYDFVRKQRDRRIIPIKGASPFGADILAGTPAARRKRALERARYGRPPEVLGVSQIKRIIDARLAVSVGSAGCCHFPRGRGREYYDQLTGERLVVAKKRGGRAQIAWQKIHQNVEARDCRVYAYAALLLSGADLSKPVEPAQAQKEKRKRQPPPKPKRGGLIR